MASTRLPGKVLLKLGNATVLEHALRRCMAIPHIDGVCCAVPEGADCDPVAVVAERAGAAVFRGSEDDVLDRYAGAARFMEADVVLRATSDCPLLDPGVCADVIALRARHYADFACNNMPPSWPHGLDCEAVTMAWLERARREAAKRFEREHVTPYVRNHPDALKVSLEGPGGGISRHRWTLDNERDWTFFKALWPRLPEGPDAYDHGIPLAIVEADPALAAINAGQDRLEGLKKSMRES